MFFSRSKRFTLASVLAATLFFSGIGQLSYANSTVSQVQDPAHIRSKIIAVAEKYLGTPYEFGAKFGQTRTFDCSSFVKTVFAHFDIDIPRLSRDQAKQGVYVSRDQLRVGDLVFFTTPSSDGNIGHVGIYAGNGMMIHTYGEGGVKYTPLDKTYWDERYVTARRVIR